MIFYGVCNVMSIIVSVKYITISINWHTQVIIRILCFVFNLLKHFGADVVNISRGIRIIVHCQFDAILLNAEAAEDMSSVICRGTTAPIPPAEFRLYYFVGQNYAGKQYVPLFPSSQRPSQKANTRRADIRQGDDKCKKAQTLNTGRGKVRIPDPAKQQSRNQRNQERLAGAL